MASCPYRAKSDGPRAGRIPHLSGLALAYDGHRLLPPLHSGGAARNASGILHRTAPRRTRLTRSRNGSRAPSLHPGASQAWL